MYHFPLHNRHDNRFPMSRSSDFTFSIWVGSTGSHFDVDEDLPALIPLSDLWSVPSASSSSSASASSSSASSSASAASVLPSVLRLPLLGQRSQAATSTSSYQSAAASMDTQTSHVSYVSSTHDHVTCQAQYNVSDFHCCVCFEPMYHEVWQCPLGLHHVCGPCHTKIGNRCPIERSVGGFIPDPRWKHIIQTVRKPCDQCGHLVFPWVMTEHTSDHCRFRPLPCPICNESHGNVMEHIQTHHRNVIMLEESKDEVIYMEQDAENGGYLFQTHTVCWDPTDGAQPSKWMALREKHPMESENVVGNMITFITLPSVVRFHLPYSIDHYTYLSHLDVRKGNMVECIPKSPSNHRDSSDVVPYEIVQFHDGFLTIVCRPRGHTCSHQTTMFCILNDPVYRMGTHCSHDQLAPACSQCRA